MRMSPVLAALLLLVLGGVVGYVVAEVRDPESVPVFRRYRLVNASKKKVRQVLVRRVNPNSGVMFDSTDISPDNGASTCIRVASDAQELPYHIRIEITLDDGKVLDPVNLEVGAGFRFDDLVIVVDDHYSEEGKYMVTAMAGSSAAGDDTTNRDVMVKQETRLPN